VHAEPDFYIYGGDGNQEFSGTVRECWKFGFAKAGDRDVLLVKIAPAATSLSHDAKQDIIGLTDRSLVPIESGLKDNGISAAVAHEVFETGDRAYRTEPNIGITILYRDKPQFNSDGEIIWPRER
jgi:hypothetical protein